MATAAPRSTAVVALFLAVLTTAGEVRGQPEPSSGSSTDCLLVDSAWVEPSLIPGFVAVRVAVTAVDIAGAPITVDGERAWSLTVGGLLRRAPYLTGRFAGLSHPLKLVLVVSHTASMRPAFTTVQTAVANLLAELPAATEVAIVGYGDAVDASALGSIGSAQKQLAALEPDPLRDSNGQPALVEAVARSLALLRVPRDSAARPPRRVIVLVSEGVSTTSDRDAITALGTRAGAANVAIHSLAFSPQGGRKSLLSLGEFSRTSGGTFRWIRTDGEQAFAEQVTRLRNEIVEQPVISFFLPADEVVGKRVSVHASFAGRTLTGRDLPLKSLACADGTLCERGACSSGTCRPSFFSDDHGGRSWGWLFIVGAGAAFVGLAVWGVRAYTRRTTFSSQPERTPTPEPTRSPTSRLEGPRLLVLSGPLAGREVALAGVGVVSFGTAPNNTIVLAADGATSALHARFMLDQRGFASVVDNDSNHGITVNGIRVREAALTHGMTVRIGGTDVRFLAQ